VFAKTVAGTVATPPEMFAKIAKSARDDVLLALSQATTQELLRELCGRGGTLEQTAKAQLIVLKKSEDYNRVDHRVATDRGGDAESRARDEYFPFGYASYAQMIHTKSQRIISLVDAGLKGRPTNFEGLLDSLYDLINYASFMAERIQRDLSKGARR
jgi:hypothetical protein